MIKKDVYYNRTATGGITLTDPTLLKPGQLVQQPALIPTTSTRKKTSPYQVSITGQTNALTRFATYPPAINHQGVNVA